MRLLLVEDDQILATNIQLLLRKASYAIDVVHTFEDAEMAIVDGSYDLFILDWKLPDGTGLELCSLIRKEKLATPILLLTAKNEIDYKVEGLNAGADDYLTKPFAKEELIARIRSLLRRRSTPITETNITVSDLQINTNTMHVTRGSVEIALSPREFALLHYLALHKGKTIDRMELLEHVWDSSTDEFSNTVDVHIRYLRRKIENKGKKLIITVKGKGYMVCD